MAHEFPFLYAYGGQHEYLDHEAAMAATPEERIRSIWPFLCAVVTSAFFIGSIFTPWALPISAVPLAITLIGWFWPKKPETDAPGDRSLEQSMGAAG